MKMGGGKPALGLLITADKAPKGMESEGDGEDENEGGMMAAQALIKATKTGDAQGVLDAFKMLMDHCDSMGEDEESDESSNMEAAEKSKPTAY